jgi:hypothetical protein
MAMMHLGFIVGVTLLAGAQAPAVQGQAAPSAPESMTKGWLVSPGKDPFGNISFGSPSRQTQGRETTGRPSDTAKPRIVCGMTVVPVNPDADPKMVVSPKPDSRVQYKIRTLAPRVCRE